MSAHVHTWTADTARGRYTCACGVIGHKPSIMAGQHRTAATGVIPYACQHELAGRKRCGALAVHVTGERSHSRCAEHAPAAINLRTNHAYPVDTQRIHG